MANLLDKTYRLISQSPNRQLSQTALLYDIDSWLRIHQQLVIENWYYYFGYHGIFFQRFEKENDLDFYNRVKYSTIENHIKFIIDLIVSYLYSQTNQVKRWVERDGKPDSKITDLLNKIAWSRSFTKTYDDTKALNTLITGYSVIRRKLFDMRINDEFPIFAPKSDIIKYGYIHKEVLDSAQAVPLPYVDSDGIVKPNKVGSVLIITDSDTHIGDSSYMKLFHVERERKTVVEYITNKIWIKFIKEISQREYIQQIINAGDNINKNFYGRVDTPFTIYSNLGDPFYVEGDSQIQSIKTLNLELDELGTGDRDTIRYHQYPILMGLNGAELPNDFVRTKNASLSCEGDKQHFEYLTWDANLNTSKERQESLRRSMSNVTGMSLISRGFMKEIGQIRSGPPLKALFAGDRATMNRFFTAFGDAEKAEMEADLRFWVYHTGQNIDIDNTISFKVEFNKDFLGIDALLEEEVRARKIESGTEAIDDVLKDAHPDWSNEEIEEAINKINELRGERAKKLSSSSDKKGLEQKLME